MCSYKRLLCVAVVFLFVAQWPVQLQAYCVCKEKGVDYCSSCSGRKIVRPLPQHYVPSDLPGIGDSCRCSKLLVAPAPLPKVPCTKVREMFSHLKTRNHAFRLKALQLFIKHKCKSLQQLQERLHKLQCSEAA